jgi:hypothetical protein
MNQFHHYGRHAMGLLCTLISAAAVTARATDESDAEAHLLRLGAEARVDWQDCWQHGYNSDANSGFEGKFIALRADGQIAKGLTYSWRQRINRSHSDAAFFDATDWAQVTYTPSERWDFSAGKQIVGIGGWEYDRSPIDLYSCSVFWNNIACYQLGASVTSHLDDANKLMLQVTQSPFHTTTCRNLYAYNLMWCGNFSGFQSLYSVNMLEYQPNTYISYIALGNKFNVDQFTLELDLMNRAASGQTFLLKDYSVMAELAWTTTDSKWRIHAKYTYDRNDTHTAADQLVLAGTKLSMLGAGVEYRPMSDVRLHATAYHSWGNNSNAADVMQSNGTFISAGVTWRMNFLTLK